jgi:hypothetical protein
LVLVFSLARASSSRVGEVCSRVVLALWWGMHCTALCHVQHLQNSTCRSKALSQNFLLQKSHVL